LEGKRRASGGLSATVERRRGDDLFGRLYELEIARHEALGRVRECPPMSVAVRRCSPFCPHFGCFFEVIWLRKIKFITLVAYLFEAKIREREI
jgi:hypothetical protein